MAGYVCALHDGEAPAVIIHQSLNPVSLVGVCREHEAQYLIGALAEELGTDGMALYEVVYDYLQTQSGQAAADQAEQAGEPKPWQSVEHYAMVVTDGHATQADICRCDRGVNHDQTGADASGIVPDGLISAECAFCGRVVFGIADGLAANLTSHVRQHHDASGMAFTFAGMDGDTPILFAESGSVAVGELAAAELPAGGPEQAASGPEQDGAA